MYKFILFVLCLSCNLICLGQENIFTSRVYWTSNPTIEDVKSDIEYGNDPTEFNKYRFDAVTWAIIEDVSNETVQFLINIEGNGVNKRSHDGRTPIFWAAYRNNIELMHFLIKHDARTDLIDDHGYSLVNFAATTGQLNIKLYELCRLNGAKFDAEFNTEGASPLLLLTPFIKDPDVINYFTKNGLSIHHKDVNGNNAFVYAAKTGNKVMMDYLLKLGLDPRINNDAAILFASKGTRNKKNSLEIYKYLQSLGLYIGSIDKKGKSALHYISNYSEDTLLYEFFIQGGCNLELVDSKGNCAFFNVVINNSLEIIEFASSKVKNINATNLLGENVLHLAVKRGDNEIVKLLANLTRDIDAKTKDGLTPLHLAALSNSDLLVLKSLILDGADKSLVTGFNETALMLAQENEQLKDKAERLNFLK